VYFVPEALDGYKAAGLEDYASGYFGSRGASLGRPSGELVTAAFGVFNPAIVIPAVNKAWAATGPAALLDAREAGATAALRRMLGDVDVRPAVEILRPVMESMAFAGRALFSGLRSLPFPTDPIGQLWRVCDYVRERRGDNHIAAWVGAGCDPVEIGLLTELYWGRELGTYIVTRGWSSDQIEAGIGQLREKGYVADGAFTDSGREYRRGIEAATDAMDADVCDALGDRADELCAMLQPWTDAVLEAKGYPANPAQFMNQP
jgi:helix-turn-helix protein